jgi:predicted DNA-binding mobile mystery protein A
MTSLDDLRVRQLDEALAPFGELRNRPPPPGGWAKTIRNALGISVRQMARRAGVSRTSITSAEAGEAKGSLQLDTLRGIADALECDLVYALVPRASLAHTLRNQARAKAAALVGRVSDSMKLESQGVADDVTAQQIDRPADELLRDRDRAFWDV